MKQQQQKLNNDKNSIKCSLNTINQTVIATIQQTANNTNNIFRIPEIPSTTTNTNEDSKIINNMDDQLIQNSDLHLNSQDISNVGDDSDDDVFIKSPPSNSIEQTSSLENVKIFTTELPFHLNEIYPHTSQNVDKDNIGFNSFLNVTQNNTLLCITQNCSSNSISNESLVDVENECKYDDYLNKNISVINTEDDEISQTKTSGKDATATKLKILSSHSDNDYANDTKSSPLKSVLNSSLFQILDRHVVISKKKVISKDDRIIRSHSHS